MFCNNLSGKIIWKRINRCITESLCCTPESNTSLLINSAAKSLQSCLTLCNPVDPTRLHHPWDSPGKNTGVGCYFLLQCLKVKSESEVTQSCPTLCDPMDGSTPGLPVHHQPLEPTQTHVHRVGDAIQPSHPLSSPSPPALNLSQHQGLFQWVSSSHQVAKGLEFQL